MAEYNDCTQQRVRTLYSDLSELIKSPTIKPDIPPDVPPGLEHLEQTLQFYFNILAQRHGIPTWAVRSIWLSQTADEYLKGKIEEYTRKDLESGEVTTEQLGKAVQAMQAEHLQRVAGEIVGKTYQSSEEKGKYMQQGLFWRVARERAGTLDAEIERLLHLDKGAMALFENGIRPHQEMQEGFLEALAWLLCAEDRLTEFKAKYEGKQR